MGKGENIKAKTREDQIRARDKNLKEKGRRRMKKKWKDERTSRKIQRRS